MGRLAVGGFGMSGLSRLRAKLGQFPARWMSRHPVRFFADERFVSITFDDFPSSALEVGGPILAAENVAGTYYTAFGLAESDTPVGYVGTIADLSACVAMGHEIGCHTFEHSDCATTPTRDLDASIRRNKMTAEAVGLPPLKHFAFPFGRYSLAAKKTVMQHYVSARTSASGVNAGVIDLGLLKSVPLYARYGERSWDPFLRRLESAPGWLIFRTHDVSNRPSPYGCTPAELASVIRRARSAGAAIVPVGVAVERLRTMRAGAAVGVRNDGSASLEVLGVE